MFKRNKQPQVVISNDVPKDDSPLPAFVSQPLSYQPGITAKQNWFKRHKKISVWLLALLIVLLLGGGAAAYYFYTHSTKQEAVTQTEKPEPAPEAPKFFSQLTGGQVGSQQVANQAVTGIMIENSPDARPQSGLKNSGVVFEAIAEGGITRFLAVYQEQKPQLVGPVRSVRMYYVDWIAAFDASVAHIGGSSAALAEVRNGSYRDIDQFFNDGAYWRATDRFAPHNVYTSFERLDALNAAKGYTTSEFKGFARKDSTALATPNITKINVTISSALYNSAYTYNAATNSYDRSQAGAPHLDREAGQISPRTVVVLDVQQSTVFEDGYRESISVIGKGRAHIFQDGTGKEVTWSKASKTAQIIFTDTDGNEVPLAPGQTWITAVPVNRGGGVTWQ